MANKVRSGLSVLGILIGVAAVIAMLAVGTGAQKSMEQQLASLGTNLLILMPGSVQVGGVQQGVGGTSRILLQDVDAVAKVPMVKRTAPEISGRVQVTYSDKNWNTSVTGTTPNYADMRAAQPIFGRFITKDDVDKRNRVAVLGASRSLKTSSEATAALSASGSRSTGSTSRSSASCRSRAPTASRTGTIPSWSPSPLPCTGFSVRNM